MLEDVAQNPMILAGAGAVSTVLAAIGGLWLRGRRAGYDEMRDAATQWRSDAEKLRQDNLALRADVQALHGRIDLGHQAYLVAEQRAIAAEAKSAAAEQKAANAEVLRLQYETLHHAAMEEMRQKIAALTAQVAALYDENRLLRDQVQDLGHTPLSRIPIPV